jgi:hypothetical protein
MEKVEVQGRLFKPEGYLAGPIGGLSWDEANTWRANVASMLQPMKTRSPLRPIKIDDETFDVKDHCFVTDGGRANDSRKTTLIPFHHLFQRDYMDVHESDFIFANYLGTKKISVGTNAEISWGYRRGMPMFVVMEEGNINENVFLLEMITRRYFTLAEAVNAVREYYRYPVLDIGGED